MRTQLLALTVSLVTCLALATSASAATLHSSPNATRTATPCTADQPCKLSFATSQAFSGDDVALAPGVYDYFGTDPMEVRPGVTVHGAPGTVRPRIEQTAPYRDCNDCTILELRAGAVLRDVDVVQEVEGGGAVKLPAQATIERSSLRGRMYALRFDGSAATGAAGSVREVLAVALDGTAIDARGGGPAKQLENVTAIGEGAAGVGIDVVSSAGVDETIEAVNTIVRGTAFDVQAYAKPWGTADGASIDDVATIEMRYSNYRGGDKANEATSDPAWPNARINGFDHNIPDDPRFASATDYHLATGSTSIDAGRASGLLGTLDLDGFQRSFGDKPDIGAYEYHPPPPKQDQGGDPSPGADDRQPQGPPQLPGPPEQPTQPEQPRVPVDPKPQPATGLAVAPQTVMVKKNVASVAVQCPATATGGCAGTLAITTASKLKVGSARYSLAAGKQAVVKVKLGRAARKLIAAKRKVKATATALAGQNRTDAAVVLKLAAKRNARP
jgi:hypothetical protein